jgi:hypothetical protein
MRTRVDLDGHVRQAREVFKALLVNLRRLGRIGDDRRHDRGMPGA